MMLQAQQQQQHAKTLRRRTGENPAIQRRRELDQKMIAMNATQKEDLQRSFISDWQAKSAAAIEKIQIANLAHELENAAQKEVERRRQRLAELLRNEEIQYAKEIALTQETTADKLARNLELAKAHKQKREEERRKYAQEQYMRMWRAGCDDLRTLDSEAYDRYVKSEQLRQINERDVFKGKDTEEDAQWLKLWEDDRKMKLEREKEEAAKRAVMTAETRAAVLTQMQEREDTRNREVELKAKEREEWRERTSQEAAEAERQAQAERLRIMEEGRKIAQWNDEFLQRKREEKARKESMEREEMHLQMKDYEQVLRRKKMSAEAMQREMSGYREFLQKRREEERRREEELNEITRQHQEEANRRQDEMWAKDRAARLQLEAEVQAARDAQVRRKLEQKRQEEEAKIAERRALEEAIKQDQLLEAEEEQDRRMQELQRKIELELQIRQKANVRALKQAELRNEEEAARMAETRHREFVQSEMNRARSLGIGARAIGHYRPEGPGA